MPLASPCVCFSFTINARSVSAGGSTDARSAVVSGWLSARVHASGVVATRVEPAAPAAALRARVALDRQTPTTTRRGKPGTLTK